MIDRPQDKYFAAIANFTPEVQGFQIDENVPMRQISDFNIRIDQSE